MAAQIALAAQCLISQDITAVVLGGGALFHIAVGPPLAGYRNWGADYFILREELGIL